MLAARSSDPFTFTTLAQHARVSRRTLYTHWGSIDKVISDAMALNVSDDLVGLAPLAPREKLWHFLDSVRRGIADPVTRVALTALLNRSHHDADAERSLLDIAATRMGHFRQTVGDVDRETYLQLVGPIFFAEFFTAETASDALVDALVDRGMELLELS